MLLFNKSKKCATYFAILCLAVISTGYIRQRVVHQVPCAKAQMLPGGMRYKTVKNKLDCVMSGLFEGIFPEILLEPKQDGAYSCGFSFETPINFSACGSGSPNALIYASSKLRPCNVTCDTFASMWGLVYCIHITSENRNFSSSQAYCQSHTGFLMEPQALSVIEQVGSLLPTASNPAFIGATALQDPTKYVYRHKSEVPENLWTNGLKPPNGTGAKCVGLGQFGTSKTYSLDVLYCNDLHPALCMIRCYEG